MPSTNIVASVAARDLNTLPSRLTTPPLRAVLRAKNQAPALGLRRGKRETIAAGCRSCPPAKRVRAPPGATAPGAAAAPVKPTENNKDKSMKSEDLLALRWPPRCCLAVAPRRSGHVRSARRDGTGAREGRAAFRWMTGPTVTPCEMDVYYGRVTSTSSGPMENLKASRVRRHIVTGVKSEEGGRSLVAARRGDDPLRQA